jgi:hypothetical protein
MVTYEQIEHELNNGLGNWWHGAAEIAYNSAIKKSLTAIKRLFDNDKANDFQKTWDKNYGMNAPMSDTVFIPHTFQFPTPNYNVSQSEQYRVIETQDGTPDIIQLLSLPVGESIKLYVESHIYDVSDMD